MENEKKEIINQEEKESSIFRLDDLDDFEVSDDDPDIRGWDVIGEGNEKLGRVDELIVDPDVLKVRYLDLEMDEELNDNGDRHILIPIGIAKLDEGEDRVLITEISKEALRACPVYTGQSITRSLEEKIRNSLHIKQEVVNPEEALVVSEGDFSDSVEMEDTKAGNDDFYAHPHFSDHKFYQARRAKKVPFVENPKTIRKKQGFTIPPKI